MKIYLQVILITLITTGIFIYSSNKNPETAIADKVPPIKKTKQKIQVAVLLDVSNSMDGLIEQAKAQLWNMVSVMGRAKCDGAIPEIEIALYEYGRSSNNVNAGYVKQVSSFTTDLDKLSQSLFSLTTNGGDEYCGQVIYSSLQQLKWDTAANSYKVIFIAGNEDFLQGTLAYTKACTEAKKKGVIVNTIYCGDKMQGIQEHWNIAGECGSGSYTNINQDARPDDVVTPYDSILLTLNESLNSTYIAYGYGGKASYESQAKVDKLNYQMNKAAAVQRVTVKGKKELYKNSHWDLVDASENGTVTIDDVDVKTLPDSLQHKTKDELKKLVSQKNIQRTAVQKNIAELSIKREAYIATEKAKLPKASNDNATLEIEIERIIKQQARLYNMLIL